MSLIKKIAVIGAGVMGCQISQLAALSGYEVIMRDIKVEFLERAKQRIKWNMESFNEVGAFSKNKMEKSLSMIQYTTDLDPVKEADLFIEAVQENLELKKKVFLEIDAYAPPHAILGTNTSGDALKIGAEAISNIGSVTKRPDKVVGIHFFAPAYLCRAVEVIKGKNTSDETFNTAVDFVSSLEGRVPIKILKESPNFLLNNLQFAILKEAKRLLDEGLVSSKEDIDVAIQNAWPLRQIVFGIYRDSDLVSPFSALTHAGVEKTHYDYGVNYDYSGMDADSLIRKRDQALYLVDQMAEYARRKYKI
jgi:3-hydroxybutyryl-CoA dehydrogenase